ncbi:MAG: hypothetical protein NTX25_00940 [Proteobacteria bacterium]|nr:hypothetical protein [Pseudomonadota bacterium]
MPHILSFFLLVSVSLLACKSLRENRRSSHAKGSDQPITESVLTEAELPACDDINLGRAFWVRSLNHDMTCSEGGTWKQRLIDTEEKESTSFGPRSIED